MPDFDPSVDPSERLGRPAVQNAYATAINRWALIVGISQYKDPSLNLKYADRDAEDLWRLLQTASGGAFEPERTLKLVNAEATTAAITRGLRSFLQKPSREDLAFIYFACHAAPDPRRPTQVLYLLTHDTDRADVAGTALRMDEIERSLADYLPAERVVIVADTCHSAAIGNPGGRAVAGGAGLVNTYLKQMSQSRKGVALLTSAEANEVSLEDERWGGGHGVFTHFLLEGLKGAADGHRQPKDGIVSVGELFEFVRDNVKTATNETQHPAVGASQFDRNLPLAVTGGADAQEYLELGRDLYALAARLDDAGRFAASARHFAEAFRLAHLAGEPLPAMVLEMGRALLAAGDVDGAIEALERFTEGQPSDLPAETWLLLGLARARRREPDRARQALEEFLKRGAARENAAWVADYVRSLEGASGGTSRALLVGINRYLGIQGMDLRGCVNDVRQMRKVLVGTLGFPPENVRVLINKKATGENIRAALEALAAESVASDRVVVHFSGHGVPEPEAGVEEFSGTEAGALAPIERQDDTYLVTSETQSLGVGSAPNHTEYRLTGGVTARELHRLLNAIPARQKLAILDTHANRAYTTLVEAGANYSMLLAAYPGKLAYEHVFELEGRQVPGGVFSGCATRVLARTTDLATLTYGELLQAIIADIRPLGFDQVPMFVGEHDQVVLSREDVHFSMWRFSQRDRFDPEAEDIDAIRQIQRRLRELGMPFPGAWVAVGRAFLSHNAIPEAVEAFRKGLEEYDGSDARAHRLFGEALTTARRYAEGRNVLESGGLTLDDPEAQSLIETVGQLETGTGHAVLVGIDRYLSNDVPSVSGAASDVSAVRDVLITRLGFRPEDVTVLVNEDATRRAMIDNFRALALKARTEIALFYFAGNGSLRSDAGPTIVSHDGRTDGIFDVDVAEMALAASPESSNLVAIFDCGFTRSPDKTAPGMRLVGTDPRVRSAARGLTPAQPEDVQRDLGAPYFRIGAAAIYPGSAIHSFRSAAVRIEGDVEQNGVLKVRGYLTAGLMEVLANQDPRTLDYLTWAEAARIPEKPTMFSDHLKEPIFANYIGHAAARAKFRRLDQRPFRRMIPTLERLIERAPQRPHLYVDLGLALAAIDEPEKALARLRTAVNLYDDPTIFEQESQLDPMAWEVQRQARYHLGRLLYEQKTELGKAVEELRKARDQDPTDARVQYYLGQSIRSLVERENLREAQLALQAYLDKGAPLGHKEEVQQFVVRSSKSTDVRPIAPENSPSPIRFD